MKYLRTLGIILVSGICQGASSFPPQDWTQLQITSAQCAESRMITRRYSDPYRVMFGVGGAIGLGDQSRYTTAPVLKVSAEHRNWGVQVGGQFNHVYASSIRTYYDPTKGLTLPLSLPEIGERYNVYFAGPYWKGAWRWAGPVPFIKLNPCWTLIRGLDRDVSTLGLYYGLGVEGMSDKNGAFWELEVGRRDSFVTRGDEFAFVEFILNLGGKF